MTIIFLKNKKVDFDEIWCLDQLNAWLWMKHEILGVNLIFSILIGTST